MSNKRIFELDYIRAISCLMVILYHYTTRYNDLYGHKSDYIFNLSFGGWAVSVFFILSGFLSLYIPDNNKFLPYMKKRIVRLYPSYWVGLIFTTIVCMFLMPSLVVSVKDFVLNLTMLQELFKADYVDGAHWTLLRELIFYVIMGLVFQFNKKEKLHIFSLIWIVVLISTFLINPYIHNALFSAFKILIITGYGQFFISGITIYYILNSKSKKDYLFNIVLFLLCCVYNYLVFSVWYTLFFVIAYLLVLAAVLNSKYNFWSLNDKAKGILKPLTVLSLISYPVYLVHQYFGYAMINLFESNGLTNEIFIIIPICLSIFIGWLINKFVAMPSAKLYKQLQSKR